MTSVTYRSFTGTAAENYERYFAPAIATPVSAGLLTAAALQPGERVLDVACGTGLIARVAAERVGRNGSVTGIDITPDMIDVATEPSGKGREVASPTCHSMDAPPGSAMVCTTWCCARWD
jgi:2-polyprenyl-3-methyl-5-hydroxy-6-metoxy-1,4-benzoquinol methylase